MRKFLAVVLLIAMLLSSARAYGPQGHVTVGALADKLLEGKPVEKKIAALLDGLTLAEASLLPDKIKDWDKAGPEGSEVFHLPAHPKIEKALLDFWEANPPKKNDPETRPSHHWFHYTDVPVEGGEKYADGRIGRQKWDVVHMIPYCIRVLDGSEPETNARKITKPMAVILLAHYVGDIHQPLHVGAEFFDGAGKPTRPTDVTKDGDTQGGNTIILLDVPGTHGRSGQAGPRLHAFWDDDAVASAYRQINDEFDPDRRSAMKHTLLIEYLAKNEPKGWKPAAKSKPVDWAEAWANEILPIAAEAHARLIFTDVTLEKEHGEMLARGNARPREMPDKIPYMEWAGKIVKMELHKGGWRLAELLQRVVK
jgi:hypothetical protein